MPPVIALNPSSGLIAGSVLEGVRLRRLDRRVDERGAFTEIFQEHWRLGIQPVQWSMVASQANVLRGLHLHRRHQEYFSVCHGRATIGLRDVRPWSPTRNRWSLYEFSGDSMTCLVFPPGIIHGWYFHEASLHLQAVSESHADYDRDDNLGCHWADPGLEIPWPCVDPVLSPRAAGFPPLIELLSSLTGWERPSDCT